MKKLLLSYLSFVMILAGTGYSFAQNPVTLRFADIHPSDYPTTIADFEIAKIVKEKTNGRVIIEVFHSQKLGDEVTVIKKVRDGEIDLTRMNIAPITAHVSKLNAFQIPFVFRDGDHMFRVVNGTIGKEVFADFEKSDLIGFGWLNGGSRSFYTKKQVKSVNDLKGLKIRTLQSDLMMSMIESFGAKPFPMPHGDVYQALKEDRIDGAENNYPTYEVAKHYEVAPYYVEDEHTRNPDPVVGSKKSLTAKLSENDIEIIKKAVKEVQPLQLRLWDEKVKASKDKVVAGKSIITVLSPEQKKAFEDAMTPVYDRQPNEIRDLIKRIKEIQ